MIATPSKWKLVIYLLGIFAAGAISGWVVAAKATKERMYSPPQPQEVKSRLKELCDGRLKLTPEQQKQFDAIIEDNFRKIESLRHENMQQIGELLAKRSERIMKILTPEQQKEFQAIEKERRESFKRWGHRGPKGEKRTNDAPDKPQACRGKCAPGARS
jgi:Spy/CpxP family protein refolding chaperone